jgi:hypothetical protein
MDSVAYRQGMKAQAFRKSDLKDDFDSQNTKNRMSVSFAKKGRT